MPGSTNAFDQFDSGAPKGRGMPGDAPADKYPDPVAHPIRYLASTYGRDVAGAVGQLVDDVTHPGGPIRLPEHAPPSLAEAGLDLSDIANQLVLGGKVNADAVQVPLTALIGGPLHAGFIRPLAQIEYTAIHAANPHDKTTVEDLEHDISFSLMLLGPDATEARVAQRTGRSVPDLQTEVDQAAGARAKAARRMLKQGKVNPDAARQAAQEHRDTGAGDPRLLDVMEQPGMRVVRSAGARMGDADTILEQHRRATRAEVSERATQRTEDLRPHAESVESRRETLERERSDLARKQYREPYAQPIQGDDRLIDILNLPEGFQAMGEARATARARSLDDPEAAQQYHEIGALRDHYTKMAEYEQALQEHKAGGGGKFAVEPKGLAKETLNNPETSDVIRDRIRREHGWQSAPKPEPPTPPTVSAGTIDRIRIALRGKAEGLKQNPKTYARGTGLDERHQALDAYLDDQPHLQEARAAYKDYSTRLDQLDFDESIAKMRPEEFKRSLEGLTKEQRAERVQAVVERLAKQFGSNARGAQGLEDTLTTGYNARANLRELLGAEVADKYLRAIDLIGQNVDKANFAASRVGSQTAMIQEDLARTGAGVALKLAAGRGHWALHDVARFLDRHLTRMSEDEARQIAEWAVGEKDVETTLKEILDAAKGGKGPKGMPPQLRALIPAAASASARGQEDQSATPDQHAGHNPFDQFDSSSPSSPSASAPAAAPSPASSTPPAAVPKEPPAKDDDLSADAPPPDLPMKLASLRIDPHDIKDIPVPGLGTTVDVNAGIAPYVEGFMRDLAQRYPITKVVGDRGHNFNVAGTNVESAHKAGLAVDINPSSNRGAHTEFDPAFIHQLCAKWGCKWGRDFNTPDSMHFTWSSASGGPVKWTPEGARPGPGSLAPRRSVASLAPADQDDPLAAMAAIEQ